MEFSLTKEEYDEILTHQCYYCGGLNKENQIGIDRINNTKGYTKDNSRACCGLCNVMKSIYPDKIIIKKIETILQYKKLI